MDRRGTSVWVPIGIGVVFVVLAFLMLIRSGHDDAAPPPEIGKPAATPDKAPK